MNELLSADELSDLLEAVSEGQPGGAPGGPAARERSIQALDFRAPGLLSREQLRLLQQLHDAAAVAFSCTLSDAVSAPVEVTVASVAAAAFGAFSNALPASACIQTFRACCAWTCLWPSGSSSACSGGAARRSSSSGR